MANPTRFCASEPLQIFQDEFYENATPMISHAPMPCANNQARRPLSSSNANVVLHPPSTSSLMQSPFKSTMRPSTSPLIPPRTSQANTLNMVSIAPPSDPGRPTDSMMKKQPMMSRFKTMAQKPVVVLDNRASFPCKESAHPRIYPAPPAFNLSIESYYQKPTGKRVLLEAPAIQEARPAKKPKADDPLPSHDSFPPIADDGTKPGHSYAMLIGMAILRAPNRRLTLSHIYRWISDTYSFYGVQDAGWQNSIRHNLSLNKAFIKQERPRDDPGKGNYWAIEPGMEHQFMREKTTRKSTSTGENLPVMSTRLEPSQPMIAPPLHEPALPPQMMMPIAQPALPVFPASQQASSQQEQGQGQEQEQQQQQQQPPAPLQPELSSDATIPVSDNVAPEDVPEKSVEHDTSLDSGLYSPGHHAAMHSSPPIPRHVKVPSGTPPRPPRLAGSSASRSRKRKFASMDDSGYISSLDSSVMRPNQKGGLLLTSEADRPRIKRGGRAEEEIARLRASSYDSPTKGRSWNGFAPQSSSPLRQANESHHQMPPPLTPAVKLRAPVKPPPSVSPNTNLRMHRSKIQHMLQSPLRRMTTFQDENDPWSPAFQLDESAYSANDFSSLDAGALDGTFDIFRDSALDSLFPAIENGSPEKRSTKRVRLDHHRAVSASILGDITNSASRRPITSAPLLKVPGPSPARLLDTPSKVFDGLPSPSKLFSTQQSPSKMPTTTGGDDQNVSPWITLDEFCGTGFFEDVGTDLTGMDMLQGFEKIGSSSSSSSQPSRASQALLGKPHLGRSNTSAF